MTDCPGCAQLAAVMDRLQRLEIQMAWVKEQAKTPRQPRVECLTEKDAKILRLIHFWWREYGRAPKTTELAGAMGVSSGSIDTRLAKLRRLGVVSKNPDRRAGAIKALYDPDAAKNREDVA